MKKIIFLLPLLFCLLSFGQSAQDSILVSVKIKNPCAKDTIKITWSAGTIKIPINIPCPDTLWRGMYVNSTSSIAGNKAKEDALIADCNKLKLTHLSFYSLSGANSTALAALFVRIRKETKVVQLCPTASSGNTFTSTYGNWNASHPDESDYDVWNLEYEPWNASNVATAWSNNRLYLQQMTTGITNANLDAITDYFGWWSKYPMTIETPDTLVKYLSIGKNFFLLHDYRVKPDYNYMNTRLTNLNDAAKKRGVVIRLRPIFSCEPDFLQPWLKAGGTLDGAFWEVYNAFKAKNFSNIIMDGWMAFHLDFWRASQPVPALMSTRSMVAKKPLFSQDNFKNKTTKKSKRLVEFTDN